MSRLYAIVDRTTLDARGVGVRAFAEELRERGVRLVQYRDKDGSPQQVLRAAEEIRAAFAGTGATLILNDRADLAVLAGWDGVHVGQGDLPVEDARRVLRGVRTPLMRDEAAHEWGTRDVGGGSEERRSPSGMTERKAPAERPGMVGISTHNEEQVRAVEASGPDYVAVGPVFATASKANAEPVIGLEGVRRARALTQRPLVAIGGITRENAASVIAAGADAVAVIGALLPPGERVRDVARDFLEILG